MLKAIYLREMRSYFHSPIAYVLLVMFQVLSGFFFFLAVASYASASMQAMQNPMAWQMNLQDWVVGPLQINMGFTMMLITALLTMRLVSEEKRSGTLELLLSYPLTDTVVVLGKFLAAWTVYALMLLCSGAGMAMLFWLGEPYLPSMLAGYLGLMLLGAAYIAVGILASALTENQIVAAVISLPALMLFWVLGWASSLAGPQLGEVLKSLGTATHFESFSKGLIDTADLAYYLLFTVFFLFITIRVLEAKRWKA
jgi:ABC-2 type transport system permease protein